MADVTTNGVMTGLPSCGGAGQPLPVAANGRCGTIWGPDPNFLAIPGATIADQVFPRMTQFLAADPNRIGLYLRSQFVGVRITNQNNGQGVPLTQTMGNPPGAGGTFELILWGPPLYVAAPWFMAVADVAGPPIALDQLLTWIEFFKV